MCNRKRNNSLLGLKELRLVLLQAKELYLVLLQAKVVHQDQHQADRLGTLTNKSEYLALRVTIIFVLSFNQSPNNSFSACHRVFEK